MSIWKKVFCLTVLLLPACLYAQSSDIHFKNGFYGGAMLGANIGNASWDGMDSVTGVNDFIFPQSTFGTSAPQGTTQQTNFAGRVFGGYQLVSDKLFSAIEVGGNFSNDVAFSQQSTQTLNNAIVIVSPAVQSVSTSASTQANVSLSGNNLYFDLKPGLIVTPHFLIYGRAGLSFLSNLQITDTGNWTQTATFNFTPPVQGTLQTSGYSKQSVKKTGLRLGFGAEYLLSEALGVVLDYTYTTYGSISTSSQGSQIGDPGNVGTVGQKIFGTDSPTVSVHTQTILLGLSYHF